MTRIFREAGIEPRIIQELDQLVTAYHFASQGIGATFVSSYLATAKNLPGLCYFKIDSKETEREFYAVTRRHTYTPKAVEAFIDTFVNTEFTP